MPQAGTDASNKFAYSQNNNQRCHRNYMRGNDEIIEPPVTILEGLEPDDYPLTKRAVDAYSRLDWEILFLFYGWGFEDDDTMDMFRDQWRGASCTHMD